MSGPLAGIRVLDFCWIGAGALVTKAMGEAGAEIIRVESRSHPDNLRLTPPFRPGTEGLEASGYFASRNPDKKSFALNMSKPEAREIALELASNVDAVTSNFRPGIMEKWGLSYPEIKAVNEDVIYLVMPMQGNDGPHSSFIGFGSTIAALGGLVSLSGEPGRTPVGTGTHYPDHVPNPGHGLVAVLAALFQRAKTGKGQAIELSQFESTVNVIGSAILAGSAGFSVEAVGNRKPGVVPRGTFRTSDDRWVAISCSRDEHWLRLQEEMASDGVDSQNPMTTSSEREARRDEVNEVVAKWVAGLSSEIVAHRLARVGVPSGLVNTSADVLEDPRLAEREFWHTIEHPVIGELPMFRLPFVTAAGRTSMTRPPLLGEHTWEIASEVLGMSSEEYDRLTTAEVLY
ncbi:MAG TPA: CoA transferase [Acidimicrobiia bacterium]|nr:CoA transferase [Acidimicrobiia bacterium]